MLLSVLTALVVSFLLGPKIIAGLRKWQKQGQPIRADGPESITPYIRQLCERGAVSTDELATA